MYRNQCNPRDHFVIGNISIFPADSCINRIAPYVVEIEGKLFAVNGKAKLNRLLFSSTGTCALLWPLQDYSPSKISNITLSMHLTSECGYIKYHIVIPYVYHWKRPGLGAFLPQYATTWFKTRFCVLVWFLNNNCLGLISISVSAFESCWYCMHYVWRSPTSRAIAFCSKNCNYDWHALVHANNTDSGAYHQYQRRKLWRIIPAGRHAGC